MNADTNGFVGQDVIHWQRYLRIQIQLLEEGNFLKAKLEEIGRDFFSRISAGINPQEPITLVDCGMSYTGAWILRESLHIAGGRDAFGIKLLPFVKSPLGMEGKWTDARQGQVVASSRLEDSMFFINDPWEREDPMSPVFVLNTQECQFRGPLLSILLSSAGGMGFV